MNIPLMLTPHAAAVRPFSARLLVVAAVLVYWALCMVRLDALPTIREDEPWQTAPGYSLFTRGVYGSDLFADFAHMDQRYYLFQPTFSLLLGLVTRVSGLGLFQVRFAPVALGALTMCLTYVAGARLGGRTVGVLAAWLMLLWRWSASVPVHASGVILLDESRIARYDALVPVWGLAAWYVLLRVRQSQRLRDFFLTGLLVGLAGLAHLYGLFWLSALPLILFWDMRFKLLREPPLYLIVAGAFAAWLPWLLYVASGWPDFVAQTSNYANRFALDEAQFYLSNLINEPLRYGLSRATLAQALTQPGVWLLFGGVPGALVWLWRRARTAFSVRALLVPATLLPCAFALLLRQKIPGYLLSVLPLFALVLAYAGVALWRTQPRTRALLIAAALWLTLDSALGIAYQQNLAAQTTPYHEFMLRVRAVVPSSARVLALHQYWMGLEQNDFRSYGDVFFLTNPAYTRPPVRLDEAFERVAPDIFIVDAILGEVIALGDGSAPDEVNAREFALRFHQYMDRHHARELGRVVDKTYGTLIVYAVD